MTLNEEKCPDGQYYCNDSKKCKPIPKGHHVMPDGKLMKGEKHSMNEVAPPTKKHERMVKHIKKSYGKDGGLSDEEKSIAYATAWKNYNKKESFGFEIDKGGHKKASKKAKMRNLARGNENPNEKAAAEKKAGGPKLMGEGKRWDSYKKAVATVLSKKKDEKKPEKAMDAGARAKRKLQRKEYRSKVSPFIPDELKD